MATQSQETESKELLEKMIKATQQGLVWIRTDRDVYPGADRETYRAVLNPEALIPRDQFIIEMSYRDRTPALGMKLKDEPGLNHELNYAKYLSRKDKKILRAFFREVRQKILQVKQNQEMAKQKNIGDILDIVSSNL